YIEDIHAFPNTNYILVKIHIGEEQQPGTIKFRFQNKKNKKRTYYYHYPLHERMPARERGIDANDLMYLIFPDRFSNGDTSNDIIAGMNETRCDRTDGYARHGGDIQGIINHLDYLTELGIKSLWINPLIENNQPKASYHGYAATDLYKIDPRFGTNELYKQLNEQCHARGIKVVADVVFNHWGNQHPLFKDAPDSNWFHWYPTYTKTNYRAEVLLDPYASEADKALMSKGWFDKHMPDLNQSNPELATYLIQNAIWWIEYADIDAYRIDTYAYPDQVFIKRLNESILAEYPDFFLYGETWVQGSPVQAYFTGENKLNTSYSSSLSSVTDFQLYYAITKGLTERFGWEEGLRRIQMTLAHDVLYKHPNNLVTFLDNHDLSRFYSMVNEDDALFKMGIAMLYTLRGIPCIYYGTEIGMKNFCDPDTKVREDFPGGWPDDAANKFTAQGRNEHEEMLFNYMKTLGQWRKANTWLGKSQLTQFVPEENTYVYFRHDGEHTLMCIYNANETAHNLNLSRFAECIQRKTSGLDIITGQRMLMEEYLTLAPKSVQLIQLY
ncbi:MAG TPA: alpha-amylase family glycosyl hydrolase, partial [Flavobacteriales bacterium]